jgi:hypothetical protein
MIHDLKCWPEYYNAVNDGIKNFDVRNNDRNYKTGDMILLREWDPDTKKYTGRLLLRKISFILLAFEGLKDGFVVLNLDKTE